MPVDHKEVAFEDAIEDHLLKAGGYQALDDAKFDRERAIFPEQFVAFVQDTQPETWQYLEKIQGASTAETLVDDLCKSLDSFGCLNVLRHGFKCLGRPVKAAYFAPAHGLNPDVQKLYDLNRLAVTRQLHYSPQNENSLDLTLSLNGIPVATAELKNPMSGQTVEHAKSQYRNDRSHKDKIFDFKKRALVHFAVDPNLVFMTTKLAGKSTYFLPFNLGRGTGAGNPDNPDGYRTSYLWEDVWSRDSWMDILGRFMHLQVEEKRIEGRKIRKETMIFPRYHQLDAVRKLVADARKSGAGTNYLVQHSAGSGKSNSIAWLCHRLASLHTEQDEKVFDSVIVVTDRVVLDKQLQDTIYQFEHKQGVVVKIDEQHKSKQLADALQSGTPIIITTIQTFPFVTEKLGGLPDRKYAVIIDEAHSSASGETAAEMKGVLAADSITQKAREEAEALGLDDHEEEILKAIAKRGRQDNISFFAFTATPKYKTLEVFGHKDAEGNPVPFHLYSMRQAIEEKFILDVLRNYTTYKAYYGLIKAVEDDPEVDKKKAASALARFMSLHPHNIAQKVEVIVEHFRAFTRHKIGGKAKAMVVTSSRLHAVRFKQACDKYIAEKGYSDIQALVAFSGTVEDPDADGVSYTEPGMNLDCDTGKPIGYKQLPERFESQDYHLLIVADKYQTGFDQPLLHTMYVDKRLAGIQAVQTLSRLNRTHAGKEDTFVLDFLDQADEVYEAFKPYYEQPAVKEEADPHRLYTLKSDLDAKQVYHLQEVEDFCKVFFKPKERQTPQDHAALNARLDPAVTRFNELEEKEREEFRALLQSFRNLYSFLAQIIPYQDTDLEKLYTYVRFLLPKLPKRPTGPTYIFDDEVSLKCYRLQKISEGSIDLKPGEQGELKGPADVGTGKRHEEQIELSRLIDQLNERFGTEFTLADQLFFDQIREEAVADEEVRQAALANKIDGFKFVFDGVLEGLIIDRMEQNEEIFARFMNDKDFQKLVAAKLLRDVYEEISEAS